MELSKRWYSLWILRKLIRSLTGQGWQQTWTNCVIHGWCHSMSTSPAASRSLIVVLVIENSRIEFSRDILVIDTIYIYITTISFFSECSENVRTFVSSMIYRIEENRTEWMMISAYFSKWKISKGNHSVSCRKFCSFQRSGSVLTLRMKSYLTEFLHLTSSASIFCTAQVTSDANRYLFTRKRKTPREQKSVLAFLEFFRASRNSEIIFENVLTYLPRITMRNISFCDLDLLDTTWHEMFPAFEWWRSWPRVRMATRCSCPRVPSGFRTRLVLVVFPLCASKPASKVRGQRMNVLKVF